MHITDDQMLFLAMCLVPVKEDITLKVIREHYTKRDKPWSEADAQAEYRLQRATAILRAWERHTHKV